MKKYYLIFDGQCGICTSVASRIESASDGAVIAKSAMDEGIMRIAADSGLRIPVGRPALLVVGTVARVHTGVAMTARLTLKFGPRKAARIARIAAESLATSTTTGGRRAFLRKVGITAAVASGLTFGADGRPAAAESRATVLNDAEVTELLDRARANDAFRAAEKTAESMGYAYTHAKTVGFDYGVDGVSLLLFLGHREDAERRAAALSYLEKDGQEKVFCEALTRNGDDAPIPAQAVPLKGRENLQESPSDYFGCMSRCVGDRAMRCRQLRYLPAVAACWAVVCGREGPVCHRACARYW